MKKPLHYILLACLATGFQAPAQSPGEPVRFHIHPSLRQITVEIGGRPFTTYRYSDTLAKPVLFPLCTASGHIVTRGFPMDTRPGERTDHPHQAGLWFTYEDVNGFDFWNNSYAVTGEKRSRLGHITQDAILLMKDGSPGMLKVRAWWETPKGEKLLREVTTFIFSGDTHSRQIDRITTLTAMVPVTFPDRKDGLLGIRVARALELPSAPLKGALTGKRGRISAGTPQPGGNYLTSEGLQGDSAWGSRGRWCMLYGSQDGETESITIFDHPRNPGYPTWWHARGYGLFAANPLAPSAFDKQAAPMDLHLDPGSAVTFRYRVRITDGTGHPDPAVLDSIADAFAKNTR